jgi:hypothetical protein
VKPAPAPAVNIRNGAGSAGTITSQPPVYSHQESPCPFVKSLVKSGRMNRCLLLCAAGLPLLAGGCLNIKTEPIEVKPIHITVDVNVKVEKALDDFFGDLDKKSTTLAHEEPKP